MPLKVTIRSLNGEVEIELPEGATVADAREAANLAQGISLRADGQAVSDESSTPVRDGQTLVGTPPDAKHGLS